MKTLTKNQRAVLDFLERHTDPYTAAEIASAYNAPVSSVRSALATLARHGRVEVKGTAFSGGQTWGMK